MTTVTDETAQGTRVGWPRIVGVAAVGGRVGCSKAPVREANEFSFA